MMIPGSPMDSMDLGGSMGPGVQEIQIKMAQWILHQCLRHYQVRLSNSHLSNFVVELIAITLINQTPYACHYNLRFVYLLPHFSSPFICFEGCFFRKLCPYVWLVFKSGL